MLLSYEEMTSVEGKIDLIKEIIKNTIPLPLSETCSLEKVEQILRETSFTTMHAQQPNHVKFGPSANRWKREWTSVHEDIFHNVCNEVMKELGYE
jgi:hypothetical protein